MSIAVEHHHDTEAAAERSRMERWASSRGLRRVSRAWCLHWVGRGRCAVRCCEENHGQHNWMDHTTGWRAKDGKHLLLCQPYQLGARDLRDMAQAAERFDLHIEIHGNGWYGNGTIAIELTRRDQVV